MARKARFSIPFPHRGVFYGGPFNGIPEGFTPKSQNVWAMDPATDRYRGGVRPVLKAISAVGGIPYNWCRVSYVNASGQTRTGIAVTWGSGTRVSLTGTDWGTAPSIVGTPPGDAVPGTNFASCACYLGYLIQARGDDTTYIKQLPSGADTVLTSTTDPVNPAPTKCGIVIAHADRLWLMGDTDNPHLVYASAVGDLFDWDYSDPTEGGAFTSSGPEGGVIGDPIVAAISHDDNWLFIGSTDSIYAVNGNPKIGGLTRVHDTLGPLTNRAWCKGEGPNGTNDTYLMTRAGFGVIRQGSLQFENLSDTANIRDLKGLNPGDPADDGTVSGDEVVIGYDSRWKQVHIFVNPTSGSDYGYAYDVRTGAFWPQSFSNTISLIPVFPQLQTASRSTALPLSSGGTVYQFDDAESLGGGNETFNSYLFHLLPLAGDGDEGILHTLVASLAEGSEDLDFGVYVGDTAEEAFRLAEDDTTNVAASFSGSTWSATSTRLLNYTQHPRRRGGWACIKIFDISNRRWLLESLFAEVVPAGRKRVG